MKLFQITGPHFCAGFITHKGVCVTAAPYLKWLRGKTEEEIRKLCYQKGHKLVLVDCFENKEKAAPEGAAK